MATPHNKALKGEIAKTVLLPGDPLRAKYIAETFLEDAKLVSDVRNMYIYTGKYKNQEISVMGTGMGIPSIAIAASELALFYEVENLIRVGSFGSYVEEVQLGDICIALGASTDSNYAKQYNLNGTLSATPTGELLFDCVNCAKKLNIPVKIGKIFSSDIFYSAKENENEWKKWANLGHLGVEMEAYGLYCLGAYYKVNTLAVSTCSDNFITNEKMSAIERQISFNKMIELVLETTIK